MHNSSNIIIYRFLKVSLFINLMFDFVIGSFEDRSLIVIFQILFLFTSIIFLLLYVKPIVLNKPSYYLLFFFLYTFCLIPLSSNIILTLNIYMKILCASLVYVLSYNYVLDKKDFLKFINFIIILCTINYIYFLYSTIFNVGQAMYKNQILFVGHQPYASQFIFPIMIISILSFYNFFAKQRYLRYNLFIALSILFMILSFRRSNFLILAVGLILMLYLSRNFRVRLIKFIPILAIVLIFLGSFVFEQASNTLESRQRILILDNYFQEGRMIENFKVWDKITESSLSFLFGSGELYNSSGNYSFYTGRAASDTRIIHNDYARVLFGSGILGLLLYLSFIFSLFNFSRQRKRNINKSKFIQTVYNYNIFLIIVLILVGLSSGISNIFYRSVILVLLGFTHKMLDTSKRNNTLDKNYI